MTAQNDQRSCLASSQPVAIITDLDGTLLGLDRKVSEKTCKCLHELAGLNIVRVIATGRSCYSYFKTMPHDFPADFLIFSSGAGIMDLRSGEILRSASLNTQDVAAITTILVQEQADFMVHLPVPDNHHFVYYQSTDDNPDFIRRLRLYTEFGRESTDFPTEAAQIIAIFPEYSEKFRQSATALHSFQITRSTSPLDGYSQWMEIFPPHIHKGTAALWLLNHLGLGDGVSVGISNDYNDIDLLECTSLSYVVANAPPELRARFRNTRGNDDDGVFHVLQETIFNRPILKDRSQHE